METTLTTIDTYLAALNETDAERRAELVAQAWTPDATYADPLQEHAGHAGMGDLAAGVHAAYPGHTFRRTTEIDGHHDLVRFGWELVAPDGSLTVAGIDVADLAEDGRLRAVRAFFGELAAR
jgi:hypothetical protein